MRCLVLWLLLVQTSEAKTGPKATSTTTVGSGGTGSNPTTVSTGTAGHHGPYEEIGNMLDRTTKASFFKLLKQLKEVKNGDLPEAQKNATRREHNNNIHKLIGDEKFAKFTAVHRRQAQNLKTLKKDTVAPKKSPGVQAASSSPAGSATVTKKKKSSSATSAPSSSSAWGGSSTSSRFGSASTGGTKSKKQKSPKPST